MYIDTEMALGFDDVLLIPQYSKIKSRKDIYLIDPKIKNDSLPVMSSPMDTVTSFHLAVQLMSRGGIPIFHRNQTRESLLEILKKLTQANGLCYNSNTRRVGVAVSSETTSEALAWVNELIANRVEIICLDIAHGHTEIAKKWLEAVIPLRGYAFNNPTQFMVGSVCTYSAVVNLKNWGADIIRFGVGNGSICSTRLNTGHGYPQFSGLIEARKALNTYGLPESPRVLLVADGGIRNAGDAAKALAAGADYVMLGSMLAGTDEAPGEVIEVDGRKFKSYRGMASRSAQEARLGKAWSVEGVESLVPSKGPVGPLLDEFAANLKSAYSYTGANGLREFQNRALFVRVSPTTISSESGTHIFNIANKI